MNRRLLLLSVLALAAPLSASAHAMALRQDPSADFAKFAFPTSPGGKAAAAFFRMMADGSDAAIREFEKDYRASAALAEVKIEERIQRTRGLRERFGELKPTRVVRDNPAQVVIAVSSAAGGDMEIEFNMAPLEPARLESIGVATFGPPPIASNRQMSAADRAELVERVARVLVDNYVFPDVAGKMAEKIRAAVKAGDYDALKGEGALAARLTQDLRSISRDRHLAVRFQPESAGGESQGLPASDGGAGRDNFEFKKVEHLDGNIGYLRLDLFHDSPEAMKTADAAMAFLRHVDGLVIDLRQNRGGSPAMIRHITSYFFQARTHLNSMIDRGGSVVAEFWTGDVPGEKFRADLPIYVLTSSYSFSGAEEFAYNLKNLKRATIVGETTGGGAHPVRPHRIDDRFVVGVPFQRAMNPITRTNWEGVGVEPDVKVAAEAALGKALDLARKAIGRP